MTNRVDVVVLEGALRSVAPELAYPSEAGVWEAVAPRLIDRGRVGRAVFRRSRLSLPSVRPPSVGRPVWQVAVAAVVAVGVLLSAALAGSPTIRETVERWLGLRGVKVVQTPRPSSLPPTRTLGDGLDLGLTLDLAAAQERFGIRLVLPSELGRPDRVSIRDLSVGGSEVFLVYRARAGLPRSDATGVGLLVSEFSGSLYQPGLEKYSFGAKVERLTVNGGRGLWIEGGHGVTYLDANGQVVPDDFRLAGNVLLWEQGPLTIRIESALSEADALALARTFA